MTVGAQKKRILVVDDNEILLRAWKKILSHDGYECFVTSNPEAALEALERDGADLIICDIVMPHLDGFDLLQRARRTRAHPLVVLTTGYVCDFKRLNLDMGDEDVHVLLKPYDDIQEIRQFIRRLLEGDETLETETDPHHQSVPDAHVHLWSL